MLDWVTRRRKMTGGLCFGPPGWSPEEIEAGKDAGASDLGNSVTPPPEPVDRLGLLKMLEELHLTKTSAVNPGLLEQIFEIGERRTRALVLNLLGTQPEFALPGALTA